MSDRAGLIRLKIQRLELEIMILQADLREAEHPSAVFSGSEAFTYRGTAFTDPDAPAKKRPRSAWRSMMSRNLRRMRPREA